MGKEDRVHESIPTTTQAAAEPTSKGGLTLPAVPAFGATPSFTIQRMLRRTTQPAKDKRPAKHPKTRGEAITPTIDMGEIVEPEEGEQSGSEEEDVEGFEVEEGIQGGEDVAEEVKVNPEEKKMAPEEKKEEDVPVNEGKKEKAKAKADPQDVIGRGGKIGTYGEFLIDQMKLTKVPGVVQFLSWAAGEGIKVLFIKATKGGRGARGETFIELKAGESFIPIDDPAKPFTQWNLLKKDSIFRILIKMYKPANEYGYVDPIHELVVHAMQYPVFVKSIRQMNTASPETESALLFHFYNTAGDISGDTHHEEHGSKYQKGSTASGYKEYAPMVAEQQEAILKKYKRKETGAIWAKSLGENAEADLKMQAESAGNLDADRSYADHSMELLIAWLTGEKIGAQKQSCESLEAIDEQWRRIILAYNQYLLVSDQAICPQDKLSTALTTPRPAGSVPIASWLQQPITDFNLAFLNHIAATGNLEGKPYNMDDRNLGTQVTTTDIIGGEQRRLLEPITQALILYRCELMQKVKESFDWNLLRAEAIKQRMEKK